MNYFKFGTVLFVLLISATSSFAQGTIFANDQHIALGGHDVVAYFNQYESVRGSKENAVEKDGATYYFSSSENAAAFKKNPSAYQPAYGGYCAFAMAMKGAKVPSDPQTFKIRDGKLYLFFNDYYEGTPFNTIIPWNGNEADMMAKANTNWKNQK